MTKIELTEATDEQDLELPPNVDDCSDFLRYTSLKYEVYEGSELIADVEGDIFFEHKNVYRPYFIPSKYSIKDGKSIGLGKKYTFRNNHETLCCCKHIGEEFRQRRFSIVDISTDNKKGKHKTIYFLVPNSKLKGNIGRIDDTCKDYLIQVDHLKNNIGMITHIVKVTKSRGYITDEEVKRLAKKLQLLFTYIEGNWISPLICYDIDPNSGVQSLIWINWGLLCRKTPKVLNWYYDDIDIIDKNIFGKFLNLLSDDYLLEIFNRFMNWYIESLDGDLLKSIVSNFIVLEMLSWSIVVEINKVISEDGFDKLSAADKVNIMLKYLKMDTSIPSQLVNVVKHSKANNKTLGPEIIALVRNATVHSSKKNRKTSEKFDIKFYQEVKLLGVWYIDNVILKLIGYKGKILKSFPGNPIENLETVNYE